MCMHKSQCKPEEVTEEASNYMDVMRQLVNRPHHDQHFILNMDQTPVFFSMNSKRTLEVVGVKTIHIRMLTNDTKRTTVAVTITALRESQMAALQKKNLVTTQQPTGTAARRMPGWMSR